MGFFLAGKTKTTFFSKKNGSQCGTFFRWLAKCFGVELAPPSWYYEFTTFASNPHTTFVTLFVAKNLALETPLMPTEIGSQICTHLQECWVVISTVSFFPKAVVSGTLFIISPHSIRDSSWPQALYYERCGIRTAKKLRGSIKSKVGFHSPHCRWTHVRLDIPCKLQWAE